MNTFHIDATNLGWLEGLEAEDLCLHGHGVGVNKEWKRRKEMP